MPWLPGISCVPPGSSKTMRWLMLMHGDAVTVLNWIASIAPLIHQHPWLGIYQSWAFICTGQLDRLEPVLQDAEEPRPGTWLSHRDSDEMRISHRRYPGACRGPPRRGPSRLLILAQQALERLPEKRYRHPQCSHLHTRRGELADRRPGWGQASVC